MIARHYIIAKIDTTPKSFKCQLCGDRNESFNHIISEYSKLERKEHDSGNVCLFVFYGISTIIDYLMPNPFLYKLVSKVGDRSRGRLEGSLFNSYYTKV